MTRDSTAFSRGSTWVLGKEALAKEHAIDSGKWDV